MNKQFFYSILQRKKTKIFTYNFLLEERVKTLSPIEVGNLKSSIKTVKKSRKGFNLSKKGITFLNKNHFLAFTVSSRQKSENSFLETGLHSLTSLLLRINPVGPSSNFWLKEEDASFGATFPISSKNLSSRIQAEGLNPPLSMPKARRESSTLSPWLQVEPLIWSRRLHEAKKWSKVWRAIGMEPESCWSFARGAHRLQLLGVEQTTETLRLQLLGVEQTTESHRLQLLGFCLRDGANHREPKALDAKSSTPKSWSLWLLEQCSWSPTGMEPSASGLLLPKAPCLWLHEQSSNFLAKPFLYLQFLTRLKRLKSKNIEREYVNKKVLFYKRIKQKITVNPKGQKYIKSCSGLIEKKQLQQHTSVLYLYFTFCKYLAFSYKPFFSPLKNIFFIFLYLKKKRIFWGFYLYEFKELESFFYKGFFLKTSIKEFIERFSIEAQTLNLFSFPLFLERGEENFNGFDFKRFYLVRPLFSLTRLETFYLCEALKLPLYPDKTNLKLAFLRNRLRKQILPAIRILLNPQFDTIICKFSDSIRK